MWHRTFKTLIFFIITTRLQTTSFNCPSDLKRCTCKLINGTYQIVCDKVLFKIYNNMLTFQCRQMEMNYFEETPKLDTRNIKKVNIYDCPMPLYNSLNYFVNKLNTSALESFQFISFEANAGRTISPNIFEGLQNISTIHLSLNENIKFSSELITIPSNITITTKQLNFQVRLTREAVLFNCMTNEDQNITSFPNMNVLNNNVKVLQISHCNVAKDYSFNDIVTKLNLENINQLLLIDVNMRTNYSFENFKHLEYLKSLTFQNHISQHFSLGFIKHLHHLEDIIFRDVNLTSSDFIELDFVDSLQIINDGIAIIITTDTITIDCTNAEYKELDDLKKIKLNNQTTWIIKECSILMDESLIILKEIFAINQILSLDIESAEANKERRFTSKLFEGFEDLQELSMECIDVHKIPFDLFKHLKNVRKIHLKLNKNARIPYNIFATNLHLESMSISKGDLLISTHSNKSLDVACFSELTMDFSWLPTFDFGIITEVLITDCDLPQNKTLQQIFQIIKLEHVKKLSIDCHQFHNKTLKFDAEHVFQEFKNIEQLTVDCAVIQNVAQGLKHLTNLKILRLQIKNIEIPPNIRSIAPNLKDLELFTDLVNIFISFNGNVKIKCFSKTNDYINDIPTLTIEDDVKFLSINECSLPHNNSIAAFKNKLNIKVLPNLIINSVEVNKQKTLTSEHFAGFEDLKALLITMKVLNATEEAFKYLNNLEWLQLTVNVLHTSKSLSFFDKLKYFHLYNSKLTIIPENFLSSKKIKYFAIINNEVELEEIDQHLFSQQPEVSFVTIRNDSLKIIPEDIFINCLRLITVDLSLNRIEVLPRNIFRRQAILGTLNLSGNLIKELHDDVFSSMNTLSTLHLSNNKIAKIPDSLLSENIILRELYLEHNEIVSINSKHFEGQIVLETINMTNNRLEYFDTTSIVNLTLLSVLDLRDNNIKRIDFNIKRSLAEVDLIVALQNNNISIIDVINDVNYNNSKTITFYVENNPFNCDCQAIEFVNYLQQKAKVNGLTNETINILPEESRCFKPDYMEGRFMRDVKPIDLLCDLEDSNIDENNCPDECKCMVRAADQTLIVNCSNLNLIELPSLPNITNLKLNKIELIIDNNNITKLPSHTFPFYNAVSKLIAFNNQISDLHLDNIPILLQTLELKNNKLTFFDTNVVNVFKEIKILSLSDNSWNCECSSIDFLNFVKEYRANITDFNNLKCFDGQMMSELETDDLCFNYLLLAVILTVISTIIGIIAAIYYKFKIEIKIWLFAHNCCLWWVSEEELDRDMIYDAFIVFATPDQTMVEELVLGLESCKTPYKCCVHIRDWPPGEMIVTQVHNSIRDSRRTIVVLSPHFRESRWARFELRVALLNAFDEKRSRVIIVLNGELNDIDDMDEDLELYLKLNTYIKWTDKWFWSKLKYAMPHTQKALKFNKAKQKDEEIELQTEML